MDINAPAKFSRSFFLHELNFPVFQTSIHFEGKDFCSDLWEMYYPVSFKSFALKRKSEFVAGRLCAQSAIERLTSEQQKFLPIGESGAALWPEGIVGSITHTNNFASAVAGKSSEIESLGIDAENWITKNRMDKIKEFIVSRTELIQINDHINFSESNIFTLLFSAKESIYKCFSPLLGNSMSFLDVEISFKDISTNQFQYRFLKNFSPRFPKGFEGVGWSQYDKYRVYTLVSL